MLLQGIRLADSHTLKISLGAIFDVAGRPTQNAYCALQHALP